MAENQFKLVRHITLTLKLAYLNCVSFISKEVFETNHRKLNLFLYQNYRSVSLSFKPTMLTMQRKTLHATTVLISTRLFTRFCHASVEFLDVCILMFSLIKIRCIAYILSKLCCFTTVQRLFILRKQILNTGIHIG